MNNRRWHAITTIQTVKLTEREIQEGWHFCPEWDGLLIGPGMEEYKACLCAKPSQNPDHAVS